MPHHQSADRIITAHLHGAATRHAGWRTPEGPAREAAIRELQEIAAAAPPAKRAALLAEVAGILLGAATHQSHPEQKQIAAELLREAGADETLIPQWVEVGRERAAPVGPPFSASTAAGRRWP